MFVLINFLIDFLGAVRSPIVFCGIDCPLSNNNNWLFALQLELLNSCTNMISSPVGHDYIGIHVSGVIGFFFQMGKVHRSHLLFLPG